MLFSKTTTQETALSFGFVFLLLLLQLFFLSSSVFAQTSGSLPVAITIPVLGTNGQGGELVVYNEGSRLYTISRLPSIPEVFGVTVNRPPLVFSTATNTVPVVTSGAVYVSVNNSAGPVRRGDLLVSSAQAGVAAKALPDDDNVFGVALEDARGGSVTTVLAQFGPKEARAILTERRQLEKEAREAAEAAGGLFGGSTTEDGEEKGIIRQLFEEYSRATIAIIIAVGSLFFIMYTFRSTIINATLAVGRNPRARNAIMTVSVENIIFALIICAVAIFVAIAVLVLPV